MKTAATGLASLAAGCAVVPDGPKSATENSIASAQTEPEPAATRDGAKKRPNILFIFPDQMRADVMGCAGNRIVRTPNLDRLARGGVLLRNSYCQTPVSVPSRCSVFTGMYPHANGCKDNSMDWPTHLPNLASLFGGAGYRTTTVGKVHTWPDDRAMFGFEKRIRVQDKGFSFDDEYRAYLKSKNLLEKNNYGPGGLTEANRGITSPLSEEDHIDSFVGRKAVEEIRRDDDDRPWLLWVGFPSPHGPADPPEPYASMYKAEDMPVPPFDPGEFKTKPETQQKQEALRRLYASGGGKESLQRFISHYYGLVSLVDKWVGEMVRALEETGQLDNTVIVFASDHGECAGDHGTIAKYFCLFEGLVHVPLICHWPAGIPAAAPKDCYSENVDILPTLLASAGIEIPWGVQGRNLLPVLRGEKDSVRDFAFSEYHYQKMIRKGDWKLIHYAGKPLGELYNMADDPYEARNLYADPAHAAIRAELTDLLIAHLVATDSPGHPYDANWANAREYLKEPERGSL